MPTVRPLFSSWLTSNPPSRMSSEVTKVWASELLKQIGRHQPPPSFFFIPALLLLKAEPATLLCYFHVTCLMITLGIDSHCMGEQMGSGRAPGGKWHLITWDNVCKSCLLTVNAVPVWSLLPITENITLGIFSLSPHNNQLKVGVIVLFLLKMRKLSLREIKKWPSQGHLNSKCRVRI